MNKFIDDWFEKAHPITITFVVVLVVVSLIFLCSFGFQLLSIPGEIFTCQTLQSLGNPDRYKWVLWGGCLVETPNGYWVHYSKFNQDQLYLEQTDE